MLKTLSNATTKFVSEVSEDRGDPQGRGKPPLQRSKEGNSSQDLLGFRTRCSRSRTRLTA